MRNVRGRILIPFAAGAHVNWLHNIAKSTQMSTFGHAASGENKLAGHYVRWRDPLVTPNTENHRGCHGDASRLHTGDVPAKPLQRPWNSLAAAFKGAICVVEAKW